MIDSWHSSGSYLSVVRGWEDTHSNWIERSAPWRVRRRLKKTQDWEGLGRHDPVADQHFSVAKNWQSGLVFGTLQWSKMVNGGSWWLTMGSNCHQSVHDYCFFCPNKRHMCRSNGWLPGCHSLCCAKRDCAWQVPRKFRCFCGWSKPWRRPCCSVTQLVTFDGRVSNMRPCMVSVIGFLKMQNICNQSILEEPMFSRILDMKHS